MAPDLVGALDAMLEHTCPVCERRVTAMCAHDNPTCRHCCRAAHGDHCRTCNGYGTTARIDGDTSTYSWRKPTCPTCGGTGKETP